MKGYLSSKYARNQECFLPRIVGKLHAGLLPNNINENNTKVPCPQPRLCTITTSQPLILFFVAKCLSSFPYIAMSPPQYPQGFIILFHLNPP
jgi:hypothetical protein